MVANIEYYRQEISVRKNISTSISFPEYLLDGGFSDLSCYAALVLYRKAMPLFNAIDKRATYFSQIPIRIKNEEGKFVEDHDSFKLLSNPNADLTGNEFLYQISSYLDATGNVFLMATGRVDRPPLEIMSIPPHTITFGTSSGKFGFLNIPDSITVNQSSIGQVTFFSEETENGIRFYDSSKTKELWHIRQFNPFRSSSNFWGMSKAMPIWLEIQNYISGNTTNWSMLKRGTRLSMAWINNSGVPLTEEQWNRMQEEADKYKGENNAGGTPILDGMDVKPIQQTNRDMEFKELQDSMLFKISIVYGIPLAFLTPKAMTLNNLETSELQLYDNAVIPLSSYIYQEITKFLMERYRTADYKFTFSPHDIPVLQSRIIINANNQSKIGVNTDNEIRTLMGEEEIEGGNTVWKPANLIPVGEDIYTEDNLQRPSRTKYIEFMKKIKENGVRKYSDSEIEIMADKRGV